MSTNLWRGDAPAVAQVNTVTPSSVGIGNVFTVTINGKSISVTATATTVANVTALLAAAIAATTIAEFLEVTAADITTAVTLTANTPGVPFTQTSGATGGSASMATTTSTANSGPNDWSVAANWSISAVPVNSDDVYIDNTASSILYGLGQSAVTLTSLNIGANFTGTIGNPLVNASGNYYEYRKTRLEIGSSTVNIGKGVGSGSGRLRLSLGAVTTAINVYTTGAAIDAYGALDIQGNAGNAYTCNLLKGSVAFATEPGQVAVLVINQGYQTNQAGDVSLYLGVGCTVATLTQTGGDVKVFGSVNTYAMIGGTANIIGTGAISTLTIDAGTFFDQSSGIFALVKIGSDGVYDRSIDQRAKTITNTTIEAGATFLDPNKTITFTNAVALNRCKLSEVTLDLGSHFNIQRS